MLFPALIKERQNAVPLELIERCVLKVEEIEWHEWFIYSGFEPNSICVIKINKNNLTTCQGPAWDLYTINWKDLDSYESYEINIDKRMILLDDSIRKTE